MYPHVETLTYLHVVSLVVHSVSCIIGVFLSQKAKIAIPVYGNYVRYNLDGETAAAAFSKKEPQLAFEFNTLYAFTAVEAITAFWQLFYLAEIWLAPEDVEKWTARPLRWAEYAVTATLMTLANLVATGGNDVVAFVIALGSSVALQACGYVSELVWRPREYPDVNKDIINWVVNVQGFLLLFTVIGMVMAQVENNENTDIIWKQQTGIYAVYFASFGINSGLRARSVGPWSEFIWTETVYMVLSVTSKTSLFWLSTGATFQVLQKRKFVDEIPGVSWEAVRLCAMIVPGVLGLMYLGAKYAFSSNTVRKLK